MSIAEGARWCRLRDAYAAVEHAPPAGEEVMYGCRADDRLARQRQPPGMEYEGTGLRPAEPAVKRDQLLEGACLLEVGVIEAPDHDVGDMGKPVRPQQVARRVGRERTERILAHDPAVGQVVGSPGTERDGAALGRSNQKPADVG